MSLKWAATLALLSSLNVHAVEILHSAASAHADGSLSIEISVDEPDDIKTLHATVRGMDGGIVAESRTSGDFMMNFLDSGTSYRAYIDMSVKSPRLWSAEYPFLYKVDVELEGKSRQILGSSSLKVGFRTVEIRPEDGFYVNGVKVLLKGLAWKGLDAGDPARIKGLNANAVRLTAEGDRSEFLSKCDEIGLYVVYDIPAATNRIDEIAMRAEIAARVAADANHPSIVGWSVSDGAKWLKLPRFCRTADLESEVKRKDHESRFVAFPGVSDGVLDAAWQPSYSDLAGRFKKPAVVLPLSMLGGEGEKGGAGVYDFWRLIMKSKRAAGGFLGEGDLKSGESTIRRSWANVFCTYASGRITFENRWSFTNLDTCKYVWKAYAADGTSVVAKGAGTCPPCGPGGSASVEIGPLGEDAQSISVRITARDHSEVGFISERLERRPLRPGFGPTVGGPPKWLPRMRFVALARTKTLTLDGGGKRRSPAYDLVISTNDVFDARWMMLSESSYKIDYKYTHKGPVELYGIEFALPSSMVEGSRWCGRGPEGAWANRTAGGQWGIWEKPADWRGFISNADWLEVKTSMGTFRIKWVEGPSMFGLGSPEVPDSSLLQGAAAFPDLGFGVYSVIPAAPAGKLLPENTGPAGGTRRGDRETAGSIIIELAS